MLELALKVDREASNVSEETATFLPVTRGALEQHSQNDRVNSPDSARFSGDSGHFTASEPSRSQSVSSTATLSGKEHQKSHECNIEYEEEGHAHSSMYDGEFWVNKKVQDGAGTFLSLLSRRTIRFIGKLHGLINRTILLLGFAGFVTGAVVYGGVFVSCQKNCLRLRRLTPEPAREGHLQWPCPLYQRRHILLVWPSHPWALDGMLRRVRMGMERPSPYRRSHSASGTCTISRVCRVVCHFPLRLNKRVFGAFSRLGQGLESYGS